MTAGLAAIADGFAASLSVHGQVWTRTSDSAAINGVPARLKAEDPKMSGAKDMDFPILVADQILAPNVPLTQCMPSTRLAAGQELTKNVGSTPKYYRVAHADYQEDTGLWTVMLSPTF